MKKLIKEWKNQNQELLPTIISDVSTNNGRPPGPGPIDAWFWSWMINPLQKAKNAVNKKYSPNLAILKTSGQSAMSWSTDPFE